MLPFLVIISKYIHLFAKCQRRALRRLTITKYFCCVIGGMLSLQEIHDNKASNKIFHHHRSMEQPDNP